MRSDPGKTRSGSGARGLWKVGLSLCALLAAGLPASAHQGFRITRWGTEDGLPQGTVNDVLQTPDGELWLATFGGLVRFDGVRFRAVDTASLEGLPDNRFVGLAPMPNGGFWVAGQHGRAALLRDGRVQDVRSLTEPHRDVARLVRGADDVLWIRGTDGSAWRLGPTSTERVLGPAVGGRFRSIAVSRKGEVWVARGRRLVRLDRFGVGSPLPELPSEVITLEADAGDGIIVGYEGGLARLSGSRVELLSVVPPLEGSMTVLQPDGPGALWVGNAGGLRRLERGGGGEWRQTAGPLELQAGTDLRSLAMDREGNLWVGTNGDGLYRVTPHRFRHFGRAEGLGATSALVDDGAGGAWVVSGCTGLFHLPKGEARPVLRSREALGPDCRASLLRARDGRLWVRAGARLYVVGSRQGELESVPVPGLPEEDGPLAEGRDGSLWVVSRGGRVLRLDSAGRIDEAHALSGHLVSAAVAPDGALWIGGTGAVYRVAAGRVQRFETGDGMAGGEVRDLLPEAGGSVWIATYGRGLALLAEGRFHWVTTANGLPDNSLTRILEDGAGRFWLLSNRGLIVADRAALEAAAGGLGGGLEPLLLGAESGIPEGNSGSPAGFRAESGELWFGTTDGVVAVESARLPFNRVPPVVRIEALRVDEKSIALADPVLVPPRPARLVVEFTTFALMAPEHVRFRYRLDGLDTEWVDSGGRRSAVYGGLEPASYRLRVEARNESGIWSERSAELAFEVLPAWWQRTTVRAGALLALAGFLVALHRLRIRGIADRNRALEVEIEERQRVERRVARLHSELEHVARLASAGELATSLAHEVNQPLAAIVSNAEAGRRFLARGKSTRAEVDEILRDIARQGQRASDVIRRLRDFLRKEEAKRLPVDVGDVVDEVLTLMRREIAELGGEVDLSVAPDLPDVSGDRIRLQQVIVNLVQNALEATATLPPPRRITIRVTSDGARVLATVADEGPGVSPELVETLFEPFVTTKGGGLGMGLAICRSIVERHGGTLTFEAPAAGGALFRVELPAAHGEREKA